MSRGFLQTALTESWRQRKLPAEAHPRTEIARPRGGGLDKNKPACPGILELENRRDIRICVSGRGGFNMEAVTFLHGLNLLAGPYFMSSGVRHGSDSAGRASGFPQHNVSACFHRDGAVRVRLPFAASGHGGRLIQNYAAPLTRVSGGVWRQPIIFHFAPLECIRKRSRARKPGEHRKAFIR